MAKYLQIQIPKACHENWDKMDAAMQGKFCNSCRKNVIDFTLMSDSELANFFKKNKDNVCGRFTSNQLHTDIPIPAKKIPWLKYFFTITIPAFLFSLKGSGQANTVKGKVACVETTQSYKLGEVAIDTNKTLQDKTVKGTVTDENGKPLSYASVSVKGLKIGTVCDSNGVFNIKIPASHSVLQFSDLGFMPLEINCSKINSLDNLSIQLSREVVVTAGLVIVTTSTKKTPLLINRNSNFSIFPNPITFNSQLNIKWKNNICSDQSIEIFNQTGSLLQQEVIRTNKKLIHESINLKQLPPGTYVIKITDSKTRKSSSQQFIVE